MSKRKSRDSMILSVCITTYNLEKYIDQTLEAVLNQNFEQKYEVLIGDDGSADNTIKKIQEWQMRYPDIIKLFFMPREKGVKYDPIHRASRNRLNLLQQAKGKYITFLDGDDFYIDYNKFKKQIAILENPQNRDCVMCAHNMNFYYEDINETKSIMPRGMCEQKISPKCYWGREKLWVPAEAFIFKKEYLTEENLKKLNLNYFDDNLIVFFFLKYGKIYYIPDIMANYRQNPTEWKSKSSLEQQILSAMDLCMERQYNPKMIMESVKRHYFQYKILFKNRKLFVDELYGQYLKKAKDQNLYEVVSFLAYETMGFIGKAKVIGLYLLMAFISEWRCVYRKPYEILYWKIFFPLKRMINW